MGPLLLLAGSALAGELVVVVRDQGSGAPIAGAELTIDDAPAGQTDARGMVTISISDEGAQPLRVLSIEHQPAVVVARPPLSTPLVVYLKPGPPAQEIVVEANRVSPHAVRQILDMERVAKVPGTYGDPIRLIQSLPGSTVTREYSPSAGEIILRGSGPGESLVYLDGVEIPYLYHFRQYASVIHTQLLKEVAVYPSAFSAVYGNATGGVVAIETRDALAEQPRGGASLNLVVAGGYGSTPLGARAGVAASARRSYADLLESGSDQYTLWPSFWDYMARHDQALSPDHHITITAIGAGDQYGRYAGDAAALDPLEQEGNPEFSYSRRFHGLILGDDLIVAAGRLRTTVAYVDDRLSAVLPAARQLSSEPYGWLRHRSQLFVGEKLSLDVGVESKLSFIERVVETDQPWLEVAQEAPLLAQGVSMAEQQVRLLGGAWAEPHILLGRTTLQPGARAQWDSLTATTAVDPRLTVQSSLSRGWKIRAALGRYTQAPDADALSVAGDSGLPLARAAHAALGIDTLLADKIEVSLDGWGKTLRDVVVWDPGEAPAAEDGWGAGVELTGRYRLRDVFFSWASISVSTSRREDTVFVYDQPLAANVVFSWDFRPQWELGLRYRYASGLPYTPIVDAAYDGDQDRYLPIAGAPNSARLPVYQKLDLHLGWERDIRAVTLSLYAETWVVLPGSSALYPVYSFDYSEEALVVGPTVLPLLGGRLSF